MQLPLAPFPGGAKARRIKGYNCGNPARASLPKLGSCRLHDPAIRARRLRVPLVLPGAASILHVGRRLAAVARCGVVHGRRAIRAGDQHRPLLRAAVLRRRPRQPLREAVQQSAPAAGGGRHGNRRCTGRNRDVRASGRHPRAASAATAAGPAAPATAAPSAASATANCLAPDDNRFLSGSKVWQYEFVLIGAVPVLRVLVLLPQRVVLVVGGDDRPSSCCRSISTSRSALGSTTGTIVLRPDPAGGVRPKQGHHRTVLYVGRLGALGGRRLHYRPGDHSLLHLALRLPVAQGDELLLHDATGRRSARIEGAAQRVQEDTMRFAGIVEDLGTTLRSRRSFAAGVCADAVDPLGARHRTCRFSGRCRAA